MARSPTANGTQEHSPAWPTLQDQLAEAGAVHGSQLEALIRDNQDFAMLRPEEAHDRLDHPPWLRVFWRKHHPEGQYLAEDPTGGYPRKLRDILAWMKLHQDLPGGPPGAPRAPLPETAPSRRR